MPKKPSPQETLDSAMRSLATFTEAVESGERDALLPSAQVSDLCKVIDTLVRYQALSLKADNKVKGQLASLTTEELEALEKAGV